ncbi:MAG: Nramp family divalent metal transporter [Acidobacteria bacterium]|nr:Nramp family divalent metal transporter [Acidobacteriota bacterium]
MPKIIQHRPKRWLNLWRLRFLMFFAVVGPGFITANVDNDPGGILTYSQAGAKFGYALLWTLIPTTIALVVVQEMSARLGAVTGKGLSDLIREEFGLRVTVFTMFVFALADLGNIAAEFAGIASGLGIFGVSKFLCVPIGAALVWSVIVYGRYKPVERVLLLLSMIYVAYPISAFMAHPNWQAALKQTLIPTGAVRTPEYLILVLGLVGTTITPWMQFYLQASIVEKGVTARQYALSRWDVIVGCLVTDIVAFFIVVACGATLYTRGIHDINDAAEAAVALAPLAGKFASILFAVGLVNAALLSAAILPLATSYNICEGLGYESGVDKRFNEAREFYWLYTLLILFGAGVVLIPHMPLIKLILMSQVANGILLPFVLYFMLKLVNRTDLMGEHKNSRLGNLIAVATSVVMVLLTLTWLAALARQPQSTSSSLPPAIHTTRRNAA